MKKNPTFQKLQISYDNGKLLNNISETNCRNKKKLLDKINKSHSILKTGKVNIMLKKNVLNNKTKRKILFTKILDNSKEINEEKEKNDIEKIYKKWNNQDNILLKINNRYNKIGIKAENLKASFEMIDQLKSRIWEKALNERIFNKNTDKNLFDKNELNNSKERYEFGRIKLIEKNNYRNNSFEKKKNLDNELKNESEIAPEAFLILDKRNENLIEKIEYIIKVGKIIEKEIKKNKDNNLILPGKAIYYDDNIIIKFLGFFGSELSLNNIKTYIEINPTKEILRDITFKIITSGLATQKIYKLTIENKNDIEKFKENINEWNIFLKNIKLKISNTYNISPNEMYFFDQKINNTFEIKLLIYNQKLTNLENILKKYDLNIKASTLLSHIILSPNMFEPQYSKKYSDWQINNNLMRGGRKYHPPNNWIGIGLKVKDKYDKAKNNIWLGKENLEGEWPVAYHGIGKGNVFKKVLNILYENLKEGHGQMHNIQLNVENSKEEFPNCGEGVYFSPNIEEAEKYTEKIYLGWYKLKFQFIIMARVNPDKIRSPGGFPVIWILNGNDDEIRPYRLLIKITY